MSLIIHEKIKEASNGSLFKVHTLKNKTKIPIEFKLRDVKSIFGIEERFNKKYIKWTINNNDIDIISLIENMIKSSFEEYDIDELVSKKYFKPNYPKMLETKVVNNNSFQIIKHEQGNIITFNDLKNKLCNVKLVLKYVNIQNNNNKKKLYYNFEITEIALVGNN